jgi:SAM-dependent methyltransferase
MVSFMSRMLKFRSPNAAAGVGTANIPVDPHEQDRRRIEQVDTLWSVALPNELQEQWSLYPMSHPVVAAEVNRRASGNPAVNSYGRLAELLVSYGVELPLTRAASVCCGFGALERGLMSMGLIASCTGYDLATGAIETARAEAAAAGYDTLRYERRDLEKNGLDTRDLQIVFAHHGVHHVERLEETFDAIRDSLELGGYFHLDEFVGPDRFQWSDRQLEEMSSWLESLPERYRITREGQVRVHAGRPTIDEMIAADPSEAVRSSAIEPLVAERFEIVERRALGGTLVQSALSDIAQNFAPDDAEAVGYIRRLLDREAELIETGELTSDFVTILARRTS